MEKARIETGVAEGEIRKHDYLAKDHFGHVFAPSPSIPESMASGPHACGLAIHRAQHGESVKYYAIEQGKAYAINPADGILYEMPDITAAR